MGKARPWGAAWHLPIERNQRLCRGTRLPHAGCGCLWAENASGVVSGSIIRGLSFGHVDTVPHLHRRSTRSARIADRKSEMSAKTRIARGQSYDEDPRCITSLVQVGADGSNQPAPGIGASRCQKGL